MGGDGVVGMRLERRNGGPQGPGDLHPLEGVCHGLALRRGSANGVDARERMMRATGVGIVGSVGRRGPHAARAGGGSRYDGGTCSLSVWCPKYHVPLCACMSDSTSSGNESRAVLSV